MKSVETADGVMDLYEAVPDGQASGAVIVVQEAFGVNEHIQDVTRRFANEGYRAVAPAVFHRAGGGTVDYADPGAAMKKFEGLTDEAILMDLEATVRYLKDAGFDDNRIAVVGFCFGGRVSFLAATHLAVGAAVGFYPTGLVTQGPLAFPPLIDKAADLKTPWLGLLGAEDGSIPETDIVRLRAELTRLSPADWDIQVFDGAGHAFHNDARPNLYNGAAATSGWQRALTWIREH
jgi:carboxymethylenebutenolidase